MTRVFIALLFLTSAVMADVKSITGQIKFDTQSDNQAEMRLNSTGLGIGVTPSTNLHVNGNAIVSNQVFVGGSSGSSNLNVNGTLGYGFQTVSSNTTMGDSSIVLVDSSSDNITVTLPYAGNVTGRQYQIKKISTSNSVWISGGGNLIDDTSPIELPESSDLASVKLISDGIQWYKIEEKDISETVAADNLVGWWKLDEISGTIALDSSGYGNDGIITLNSSANQGVTSILNKALDLDASAQSDHVIVGIPGTNLESLQKFSWSLWVQFRTLGVTRYIMNVNSTPSGASGNIFLRQEPTDTINFFFYDGTNWEPRATSSTISANVWHHIAATYDQQNSSIYLDGVKSSVSRTDSVIYGASTNLFLGNFSWHGGVNGHDGKIDDIRIYNKALTPSEIQALYNQGQ